jgi:hypothetical protein
MLVVAYIVDWLFVPNHNIPVMLLVLVLLALNQTESCYIRETLESLTRHDDDTDRPAPGH